jgi:RNA polymerase sigma-32 factor
MGTTASQKKLFFNLRKAKNKIGALEDGDLRPEHLEKIATDLNVSEADVISMNRRMGGGGDASLNAQVGGADGEGVAEWQDWLVDDDQTSQEASLVQSDEFQKRHALLEEAMADLNDREKHIITERRLAEDPTTLEDLAKVYNISRERVRQIEVRAFEKLQQKMVSMAKEQRLPMAVA